MTRTITSLVTYWVEVDGRVEAHTRDVRIDLHATAIEGRFNADITVAQPGGRVDAPDAHGWKLKGMRWLGDADRVLSWRVLFLDALSAVFRAHATQGPLASEVYLEGSQP